MLNMLPWNRLITPALDAPAGTRTLFHQAAPPPGWVTDTTITDHLMRVVTGAGGAVGGSTTASNWIGGGTFSTNVFTISIAQMPGHNHSVNDAHTHNLNGGANFFYGGSGSDGFQNTGGSAIKLYNTTDSSTTGLTSPTNSTGSGSGIQPSYTTPSVRYAAYIIAQKS